MTYQPNELAIEQGGEAYLRYCSGLAIIQKPEAWEGVHGHEEIAENAEDIVFTAERLMLTGARNFIRNALPEDAANLSCPEAKFDKVAPRMHVLLDEVSKAYRNRLRTINHSYYAVRPAPFLDKTVYDNLTHGRLVRLKTTAMLDDFAASELLRPTIEGRTFAVRRPY